MQDKIYTTSAEESSSSQATLGDSSTNVSLINFENKEIENPSAINITCLEETTSKLQAAELKLKKANMMIFKLNKSKIILRKHRRKLIDQNKEQAEQIRTLIANKNFNNILNDDQIVALNRQYRRGCRWSNNTIIKALRLKMSSGSSGYRELLNQNIPLPSERTLRRKLENINFEPGICDEIFHALQQQTLQFTDDREKDCMLAIDEMSITAGEQIDQFTKCSIGLSTLPDKFGTYI